MKQFRAIFLMMVVSFLFYGCPSTDDDGHQFITIVNKSDAKITVQTIQSSKITYADTLWVCGIAPLTIESNSERMFNSGRIRRGSSWESELKDIPFVQFLIFDAEVYDSMRDYDIPCEDVNYTIPVKHYYQLKLEDLEHMNWEVIYDGN